LETRRVQAAGIVAECGGFVKKLDPIRYDGYNPAVHISPESKVLFPRIDEVARQALPSAAP
jgi:hypothetical protein